MFAKNILLSALAIVIFCAGAVLGVYFSAYDYEYSLQMPNPPLNLANRYRVKYYHHLPIPFVCKLLKGTIVTYSDGVKDRVVCEIPSPILLPLE